MIRGGKVSKRKSSALAAQEVSKKKCITSVRGAGNAAGASSTTARDGIQCNANLVPSNQTTLQSHFKPLQPKQTPSTSSNSKRRYIDHTVGSAWEDTPKIRPELPTPPFGEDSPSQKSELPGPVIPLPSLDFAPNDKVWEGLKQQEEVRHPAKLGVLNHLHIKQYFRAVLLDWLVEVAEQSCLNRETYYLSMDYIDRFLSKRHDITKDKLQLVGVTALHMAAKLEEIYPPSLVMFSDVTNGACSKEEMWQMELDMMKVLDWKLAALTVNTWLNLYLQIEYFRGVTCTTEQFMRPEYSQSDFVKIIQLIDLCSLDVQSVQFRPSMIAASALWLVVPYKLKEVTGYNWEDLISCRHWMQPYAQVLKNYPAQRLKDFNVKKKDRHNIQTHFNALPLLQEVYELQESQPLTPDSDSENENAEVAHYLTPPSTSSSQSKDDR